MSSSTTNNQRPKSYVLTVMLDITVFRSFIMSQSKILRFSSQYNDLHKVLEKLINCKDYVNFIMTAENELSVMFNHLRSNCNQAIALYGDEIFNVFAEDCRNLFSIREKILASNPRITGEDIYHKPGKKIDKTKKGDSIRLICFHPLALSNEIPTHYFGYITQLSNINSLTNQLLQIEKEKENAISVK